MPALLTTALFRTTARSRALTLAAIPFAVAFAFGSDTANASAFQLKENSTKALGRAFAGAGAAPDDYAVVVNNPAAMIGLSQGVQGDLTAIQFKTEFSGDGRDVLGRPLTGGNGGNAGGVKPVPALFYAAPVGNAFAIGAAITAPFGFFTDYDKGWKGRYSALKSDLQSPAFTLSGAWKLSDQFSLGISGIAQRTSAELSNAINFGAILLQPTQGAVLPQSVDGEVRITGDDWGFGWQLAALWKPTPNDRIGINYHSRIDHEIRGDADFTVPASIASLLGSRFVDTVGSAALTTPEFVDLSWWHDINAQWSVGAQATWTKWSVFKDLTVRFDNPAQPPSGDIYNWEDTWFGSIGADYRIDNAWTLRGGFAVDGSPTYESTRKPRVPDSARHWASVGLGYRSSDRFEINFAYVHLFLNQANVNSITATGDRLIGSYATSSNLLSVSGQYHF